MCAVYVPMFQCYTLLAAESRPVAPCVPMFQCCCEGDAASVALGSMFQLFQCSSVRQCNPDLCVFRLLRSSPGPGLALASVAHVTVSRADSEGSTPVGAGFWTKSRTHKSCVFSGCCSCYNVTLWRRSSPGPGLALRARLASAAHVTNVTVSRCGGSAYSSLLAP
jgi:hypothetical protein